MSTGTFYYWKPRFLEGGYTPLEKTNSHAPKNYSKTPSSIAKQVIKLYQQQPTWGSLRIAHELAIRSGWVPLISPNTVLLLLFEPDFGTSVFNQKKWSVIFQS
ncbi:MAG: hypothetical protein DRR19_11840 [Candidatus Parabeggiatoa sp. nov. 1]|nr:MAG: hypothetical protein DRR19_11840 [Gammaproteobacteria bacterium]